MTNVDDLWYFSHQFDVGDMTGCHQYQGTVSNIRKQHTKVNNIVTSPTPLDDAWRQQIILLINCGC